MSEVFFLTREQVIVAVSAELCTGCAWLIAGAFALAGLAGGAGYPGTFPILLSHVERELEALWTGGESEVV